MSDRVNPSLPDHQDLQATVPAQGWDQARTQLAAAPVPGSGPSTDDTLPAQLNRQLEATVASAQPQSALDVTQVAHLDDTKPTEGLAFQPTVIGNHGAVTISGGHGSGSRVQSSTQTGFTSSLTRTGTRLGRTRVNSRLQPTEQQLDERLQLSRTSVLTDMTAARGSAAVPSGLKKLVEDQGTDARYHVNRPLAAGGMGAVLDIQDNDFRRGAAMKVIHGKYVEDPQMLERFLAEAQVTAQLEHPNIVPIHDMGVMADGTLYFTMKLIEGLSLGDVVKLQQIANGLLSREKFFADKERKESAKPVESRKSEAQISADYAADHAKGQELAARFTREEVLLTFLKVLDGVGFAHSRGVVHRDIKPDNIMLGAHGEVLVVDWGIAKVLKKADRDNEFVKRIEREVVSLRDADAMSATMTGSAMGTLYYMPPEQARGELDLIDGRSDIYALGATLYELLTLKRSLESRSMAEALAAITTGDWIPLDRAQPGIDKDLVAIVHRAMALDPARRYQTCADFADDIRRFLAGQAVVARKRNLIERMGAWVAAHRQQVQIGLGVTALVVVTVGGTKYYVDRSNLATGNERLIQANQKFINAQSTSNLADYAEALQVLAGAKELLKNDSRPTELELQIKLAQKSTQDKVDAERKRQEQFATARKNYEEALRLIAENHLSEAETLLKSARGQDPDTKAYEDELVQVQRMLNDVHLREQTEQARTLRAAGDQALVSAKQLDLADPQIVALLERAKKNFDALEALPQIEGTSAQIQSMIILGAQAEEARQAKRRGDEAAPLKVQVQEALKQRNFESGRAKLAQARILTPKDPALDQMFQQLVVQETQDREERRLAEAHTLADQALKMSEEALKNSRYDEAQANVALALTHVPGYPPAFDLEKRIGAAQAIAARAARLRKASADADRALLQIKEAQVLVAAKNQLVGQLQRQIDQLQRELGRAAVDQQIPLFTAVRAQKEARSIIAEQWALAEGLANGALNSLSDFPDEAKTVEVRKTLCQLYLSRLRDARKNRSLAEINAFANLIRRFDPDHSFQRDLDNLGEISISGAVVTAKRLIEGPDTRLVASGDPITLEPGKVVSLEAGGYALSSGGMQLAVTVIGGQQQLFAWPTNLPTIKGLPLAYVPPNGAQQAFLLSVTEVTTEQYARFLNSSEVFPQLAKKHKDVFEGRMTSDDQALPYVPGTLAASPNGRVWVPVYFKLKGVDARLDEVVASEPNQPVAKISQADAQAYCAWLSKSSGLRARLPKAKEWSFAANGGDDRRIYPWGPFFVGQFTASALSVPSDQGAMVVGANASDVGPFGHRDLAGNLREWLGDSEADGKLAAGASGALIAGGSYSSDNPVNFTTTYVESIEPAVTNEVIGFRVLVELP